MGGGSEIIDTDLDTYVRVEQTPDEDTIRMGTAGVERVTVTPAGRVGIDATSPDTNSKFHIFDGNLLLQVADNTNQQGILFRNSGTSYNWWIKRRDIGSNQANLEFAGSTGTTDINSLSTFMAITPVGNVSIGTNASSDRLRVFNGNLRLDGTVSPRVIVQSSGTDDANAGELQFWESNGTTGFSIRHNSSNSVSDQLEFKRGASTNIMTLKSDGKVGIGTTTPSTTLQVSGGGNGVNGAILGNGYFGNNGHGTGWPGFTNSALRSSTNTYAIIQSSSGNTLVNGAAGQGVFMRVNNSTRLGVDGSYRAAEYFTTGGTRRLSGWDCRNYSTGQDQQYLQCHGRNMYSWGGQWRSSWNGSSVQCHCERYGTVGWAQNTHNNSTNGWSWLCGLALTNNGFMRCSVWRNDGSSALGSYRMCEMTMHRSNNRILGCVREIRQDN